MSKVAIKGNASGTGTFTLEAPNSNTDRTLTIQDASGDVVVAEGGTFKIDSSGNVGIGTSSPTAQLHLSANNASIRFDDDTTNNGLITINNTIMRIEADPDNSTASSAIAFRVDDSEAMRIDSSGRLALNTTSPNTNYTMTIQANSTTGALSVDGPSTNGYWAAEWDMPSGSTYGILFKNGGSNVGNIRINASSTSYNTSSDYRLKENVVDMTDAIDRVKALPVKRFNFISDPDTTVDGFLAHEAQEIVPEAVTGTKDAVDADGNPDYQGIDQSKLVPLLTGALKEAIARIETLEAKVAALEATP